MKVVRARDAENLMMARQVTEREIQIRSMMFSIRGEVLLKIQTALQNTSPTRRIQLQRLLDQDLELERIRALGTIDKILADSIPNEIPVPVPPVETSSTLRVERKSSEETRTKESETK